MEKGTPRDPKRWQDPSKRGDCFCAARQKASIQYLNAHGLSGIEYRKGEPDFSPIAIGRVDLPQIYTQRGNFGRPKKIPQFDPNVDKPFDAYLDKLEEAYEDYGGIGNFWRADIDLARQWTKENRDGHAWTPSDIRKYRKENHLTWHERCDMLTMELVPNCVHKDFSHYGGVYERKMLNKIHQQWQDEMGYEDDTYRYGHANMSLIITIGLLILVVLPFLVGNTRGLLNLITTVVAVLAPFGLTLLLAWKFRGIPQKLKNKFGGWVILLLFVVMLVLAPILATILFFAYLIVGILSIVMGVSNFGPTGFIRTRVTEADGSVHEETEAVYGDMDEAVAYKKHELNNRGYTDVHES